MIRTDYDISDEDYNKVSVPFDKALCKYIQERFLDEYMAYYIAEGYNMSALFKGSLTGVFNAAIDSLCNIQYGTKEDIEHLKLILKNRYNLILDSDTELVINEIKK